MYFFTPGELYIGSSLPNTESTSILFLGSDLPSPALMEPKIGDTNADTWPPSWECQPEISALLRPYSTAIVVYDGRRSQPELWDICNGCILWLPPKEEVGKISDPELDRQNPGFFDHPVLVLNIEVTGPKSATIQFARMTSLRNRNLSEFQSSKQDNYLPISPTGPHPKNGIQLRLEKETSNRGMTDPCYVCVREGIFSVDFRALRCYAAGQRADGYRHRLKEESFNQAMSKLGCSPSAWIETGNLWETFLDNHVPKDGETGV